MDISCRGGEELDLDVSARGNKIDKHIHKPLPVFTPHPEEYVTPHSSATDIASAASTTQSKPKLTSLTPKIPKQNSDV